MNLFDTDMQRSAVFSPCRTWRYALLRTWGEGGGAVAFVGLNPSTADETQDDPTVRRCIRFARDWGYSGLIMLNLFAFRATDPKDMKACEDPVGPENDWNLVAYTNLATRTVLAWGNHGSHLGRDKHVLPLLANAKLFVLGVNSSGAPKHPLYIAGDTKPVPFPIMPRRRRITYST